MSKIAAAKAPKATPVKQVDISNTPEKLNQRLLVLLPTDPIRELATEKGRKDKLVDKIVSDNRTHDIYEDFLRNFGYCHQHIFLFAHKDSDLVSVNKKFITEAIEYESVVTDSDSRYEVDYLLKLNYQFVQVINETAKIRYRRQLWPVKVILTKEHLEIRIVTMEKRMHSTDELMYRKKDLDDETIVEEICRNSGIVDQNEPLDLNRGIKALWENDDIDALDIQFKQAKSLSHEQMDKGYLLKHAYRERYEEALENPLGTTIFGRTSKINIPDFFLTKPSRGYISLYRFSKSQDQIDTLIDHIMRKN